MDKESYYQLERTQGSKSIFLAFLSILGGIFLSAALCSQLSELAFGWSPTSTARQCFYFPSESISFIEYLDRESLKQLLLEHSFFGNDSLYFDLGGENTGTTELLPSKVSEQAPPQSGVEAPGEALNESDIYFYDYSRKRAGELALLPYDLSAGSKPGEVLLSNTTAYEIDPNEYLERDYPIRSDITDKPLVLIVHTHGTESFSTEGEVSISGDSQRSADTDENIVAIGRVMSELLNESGIPTLHCEIMHDLESYRSSYDLCADTIQKYLAEYPSIKYVFDVHRDAIARQNGDIIKPLCLIDGKLTAQVMLLVGTNEKGADHPNWADNLTVAAKLQSKLTEKYERLARPINIRGASFNEQFTPGSLLIEIGSSGNTLSEAKNAARLLTYSIAEMILENQSLTIQVSLN